MIYQSPAAAGHVPGGAAGKLPKLRRRDLESENLLTKGSSAPGALYDGGIRHVDTRLAEAFSG
jgi:hypothetical protein